MNTFPKTSASPLAQRARVAMLGVLCTLVLSTGVRAESPGHRYEFRSTSSGGAHVITLDPRRVRLGLQVAHGFPGTDESFPSMLGRSRPIAALNGTYFDTVNLRPIGDLVRDGQLIHTGLMGTVFGIRPDSSSTMHRVPWGRTQNWSGFETVVGAGPTLVRHGQVDVQPQAEGFRDPHVLGAGMRAGVALTRDGRILLAASADALTLSGWAQAMKELGGQEAMCLDGGASVGMYYQPLEDPYVVWAGRSLTNILVVHERTGPPPPPSRPAPAAAAPPRPASPAYRGPDLNHLSFLATSEWLTGFFWRAMVLLVLLVGGMIIKADRYSSWLGTPLGRADRLQVYLACVVGAAWIFCCGSTFASNSGFFTMLKGLAGLAVFLLIGLVLEYPARPEANRRATWVLAAPAFHLLWPAAPRELQCLVLVVSVLGIWWVIQDNRWALERMIGRLLGDA